MDILPKNPCQLSSLVNEDTILLPERESNMGLEMGYSVFQSQEMLHSLEKTYKDKGLNDLVNISGFGLTGLMNNDFEDHSFLAANEKLDSN